MSTLVLGNFSTLMRRFLNVNIEFKLSMEILVKSSTSEIRVFYNNNINNVIKLAANYRTAGFASFGTNREHLNYLSAVAAVDFCISI